MRIAGTGDNLGFKGAEEGDIFTGSENICVGPGPYGGSELTRLKGRPSRVSARFGRDGCSATESTMGDSKPLSGLVGRGLVGIATRGTWDSGEKDAVEFE